MKARPVGRPREFNREDALEKAMQVFWARGYEGATLGELTAAMGISKPSLYAAFGDKQTLFDKALVRYADGPWGFSKVAYKLPTAKQVVHALLDGAVEISTRETGPGGCLLTHAALACSPEGEQVRDAVAKRRLEGEARLRARLREAQKKGELPATTNCAALAKYIASIAQGIAVQGAAGVSRRELKAVVEVAMQAWPRVGAGA